MLPPLLFYNEATVARVKLSPILDSDWSSD